MNVKGEYRYESVNLTMACFKVPFHNLSAWTKDCFTLRFFNDSFLTAEVTKCQMK